MRHGGAVAVAAAQCGHSRTTLQLAFGTLLELEKDGHRGASSLNHYVILQTWPPQAWSFPDWGLLDHSVLLVQSWSSPLIVHDALPKSAQLCVPLSR